jgi:DNA polymerase-3 subunit epsilon
MKAFPAAMAIIDTETTGMRPPYSRVIDIGIIRIENGKEVERYETLVNPQSPIPSFISDMTSITDADLVDAPTFDEVALEVEAFLKDAVFVAHNVGFDYAFMQSEFARIDMGFYAPTLCSAALSRALYPHQKRHSLDMLIHRHELVVDGTRHRAMPDADAVWQFFQKIGENVSERKLREVISRKLRVENRVSKYTASREDEPIIT